MYAFSGYTIVYQTPLLFPVLSRLSLVPYFKGHLLSLPSSVSSVYVPSMNRSYLNSMRSAILQCSGYRAKRGHISVLYAYILVYCWAWVDTCRSSDEFEVEL